MTKVMELSGQVPLANAAIERGACIKFLMDGDLAAAEGATNLLEIEELKPLARTIEALASNLARWDLQTATFVIVSGKEILLAVFKSHWLVMEGRHPSTINDVEWSDVIKRIEHQRHSLERRTRELVTGTIEAVNDSDYKPLHAASVASCYVHDGSNELEQYPPDPTSDKTEDILAEPRAEHEAIHQEKARQLADALIKATLRLKEIGGEMQLPDGNNAHSAVAQPTAFSLKPVKDIKGPLKNISGLVTGFDKSLGIVILDGRTTVEYPSVTMMSDANLLKMLGQMIEGQCMISKHAPALTHALWQGDMFEER